MERKVMKNLLCIGAVLLLVSVFATEAAAVTCSTSKTLSTQTCCSWKTTSSGTKYCSLWCTGSEVCVNTIFGLGGVYFPEGCTPGALEPDPGCPVTSCDVFGTVATETSTDTCDNTNLFNLNPTCGITGIAYCENHGGNSLKKNPKIEGQPFVVDGVLGIDISVALANCDKQGKCMTVGEVQPALSTIVCQNPNWSPVTFTASEFKGRSCLCPGGYDSAGTCCENSNRDGDLCADVFGDGTPRCLIQLCSLDLQQENYNPFTNSDLAYNCTLVEECGGTSATPCPPAE